MNKAAQRAVVAAGFVVSAGVLFFLAARGAAPAGRLALTFLIALGLAVRYRWVIRLLEWPPRILRTALLLAIWCVMPWAALAAGDERAWGALLALSCGIGAATEFYNLAAGQWRVKSERLSRALLRDHWSGGTAALVAAILLLASTGWPPGRITLLVAVLAIGDWARLVWMMARHRRILHGG